MKHYYLCVLLLVFYICSFGQVALPFSENNKWYFVNKDLQRIDKNNYSKIMPADNYFYIVENKKKLALANYEGKVLSEFMFTELYNWGYNFIGKYEDNLYLVNQEDGSLQKYDRPLGAGCGLTDCPSYFFLFKENNKYGFDYETFENYTQKYVKSPAIYDSIVQFQERLAFVKVVDLWGLVQILNDIHVILEPMFDEIVYERAGCYLTRGIVKKDGLYGVVNSQGVLVIQAKYKTLEYFNYYFFTATTTEGKSGYFYLDGTQLFK